MSLRGLENLDKLLKSGDLVLKHTLLESKIEALRTELNAALLEKLEVETQMEQFVENRKVVLVVGEIKSGKTTLINSLSNYVDHEEMVEDQVEVPIGKHYSLIHPDTYNMNSVFLGPESIVSNEKDENIHTSTQTPRAYQVDTEDKKYLLIDTPGLGDSEGEETDKELMKKIKAYTDNYIISAICIVVDANVSTMSFDYFFQLLFQYFNINNNFILCFTKTQNTFFKPGSNYNYIQNKLPPRISRKLKDCPVFCFDNEGLTHAVQMASSEVDDVYKQHLSSFQKQAEESWRKSALEAKRLFTQIESCDEGERCRIQ